jgi:hypothetical protein
MLDASHLLRVGCERYPELPCEGINFVGAGIFHQTMLLTLPFASGKLLERSSRFFDVEHEEASSSKGIYVLLSFL